MIIEIIKNLLLFLLILYLYKDIIYENVFSLFTSILMEYTMFRCFYKQTKFSLVRQDDQSLLFYSDDEFYLVDTKIDEYKEYKNRCEVKDYTNNTSLLRNPINFRMVDTDQIQECLTELDDDIF